VATEAHKFQVGIFVIAATAIAIGGLIWLGASHYFEHNVYAVSYFAESVQGLEPGAAVKYRGVPAGRVEVIRVAPDGDLIEVVMSLEPKIAKLAARDPNIRAQLQLSGITGLRYVEIDRHSGEALHQAPSLSFEPPHPLIPSTRSSVKAVQEALEDVYAKIMALDLEGISADARATLQAANALLRNENIPALLANLNHLSESAQRTAANLAKITGGVDVAPVMANIRRASADAQALFADLRSGEGGSRLRQALATFDRTAETTQAIVAQLQSTVQRLDRAVTNLNALSEELRRQPSRLLFAAPPPAQHPGDGRPR